MAAPLTPRSQEISTLLAVYKAGAQTRSNFIQENGRYRVATSEEAASPSIIPATKFRNIISQLITKKELVSGQTAVQQYRRDLDEAQTNYASGATSVFSANLAMFRRISATQAPAGLPAARPLGRFIAEAAAARSSVVSEPLLEDPEQYASAAQVISPAIATAVVVERPAQSTLEPQAEIFVQAVQNRSPLYKNTKTNLLTNVSNADTIQISHGDAYVLVQEHLAKLYKPENAITKSGAVATKSLSDSEKQQLQLSAEAVATQGVEVFGREIADLQQFISDATSASGITIDTERAIANGFSLKCATVQSFVRGLVPTKKGGLLSQEFVLKTETQARETLFEGLKAAHSILKRKKLARLSQTSLEEVSRLFGGAQKAFEDEIIFFKNTTIAAIEVAEGKTFYKETTLRDAFTDFQAKLSGVLKEKKSLETRIRKAYDDGQLTLGGYNALLKQTKELREEIAKSMKESSVYQNLGKDDPLRKSVANLKSFVAQTTSSKEEEKTA